MLKNENEISSTSDTNPTIGYSHKICEECESRQAVLYCKNCEQKLCNKCDARIHNKGNRAKHERCEIELLYKDDPLQIGSHKRLELESEKVFSYGNLVVFYAQP